MIPQTDEPANLQASFKALADPSRRQIISLLSSSDMTIGEVASHFKVTRAAIKKHLIILEQGNLVMSQPRGRTRIHKLNTAGLKHTSQWLNHFEHFWDDRLQALKKAVEQTEQKETP